MGLQHASAALPSFCTMWWQWKGQGAAGNGSERDVPAGAVLTTGVKLQWLVCYFLLLELRDG